MVHKGILHSYEYDKRGAYGMGYGAWTTQILTNRFFVNHGGLIAASIVLSDVEPELAARTLQRAIDTLPNAIEQNYAPNGAYAEGPMYWGYGGAYLALSLRALESISEHDLGLKSVPGLSITGDYFQAMKGPSGLLFDYGDGHATIHGEMPFAVIALAGIFNRPEWVDDDIRAFVGHFSTLTGIDAPYTARLMPLCLLFLEEKQTDTAPADTRALYYTSGNETNCPVATMRSGWSVDDAFFAMAVGAPSRSHGQIDCGSFIYEVNGERWVYENGSEIYRNIERHNGNRRVLFRNGPAGHNILIINGQSPVFNAGGAFAAVEENLVRADLSGPYANGAESVMREAVLLADKSLKITDSLSGLQQGDSVRWQCSVRPDSYEELEDGSLRMTRNAKHIILRNNQSAPWQVTPADELRHYEWESENPGVYVVSFTASAPASGALTIEVSLTPDSD